MKAFLAVLLIVPMGPAWASQPPMAKSSAGPAAVLQSGIASWYGAGFIGGKTASGEIYRTSDRTAAHKTLPFNTWVRVTDRRSGRSTVVRINNRGPYIKGRIIDLSHAAAKEIGLTSRGLAAVLLEVLPGDPSVERKIARIGRSAFWDNPLFH